MADYRVYIIIFTFIPQSASPFAVVGYPDRGRSSHHHPVSLQGVPGTQTTQSSALQDLAKEGPGGEKSSRENQDLHEESVVDSGSQHEL